MTFTADWREPLLTIGAPILSLAALALTAVLLIFDLKRPERFFYLITKPNFRSWLVIGAFVLTFFGAASVAWLLCGLYWGRVPTFLLFLDAMLAGASACYSAFLFAQAKGRDLWQSPMFFVHLLLHSLIAGGAVLIIMAAVLDDDRRMGHGLTFLFVFLPLTLVLVLAETLLPHGNEYVRLASQRIVHSGQFWLGIIAGLVLPMLFIFDMAWTDFSPVLCFICAVLALLGVWCFEDVWVKAGQSVPLS